MKKNIFLVIFVLLWTVTCPFIANKLFSKNALKATDKIYSAEHSENKNTSYDTESSEDEVEAILQNNRISVIELHTATKMRDFENKYSPETMKALSVITRTQILYSNEKLNIDLTDEIEIPEYVASTKGIILKYNGEAINPPFHQSSYKTTATSDLEKYLISVPTPENPNDIKKTIIYTKKEFKDILKSICAGCVFESETLISEIEIDKNNKCKFIRTENAAISGEIFAEKLSLPSLCFEITENDNNVTITSYGEGNGLGLSVAGAEIFVKEGKSFIEILKHYYSDIEICNIDNT